MKELQHIENKLKIGQVVPEELARFKDYLAGISSSLMDRQEALIDLYARYYTDNRPNHKSDNSIKLAWRLTTEGQEQAQLEMTQRKIKTLREAISSHLRVAHDQAMNNY